MALSAYPVGSSRCGAAKTVLVVPWKDGARRASAKAPRTVFCDKPNYHVIRGEAWERRHFDQSTGLAWVEEKGAGA
ncbi:hypothetical protein [Actinomyces culturomici]|uniref:hypothetical protein n=1 Tax=Actinomyces culturomici TaxID=1926276 RepID=UPI000E1FC145|nr:hypothetical protein [Actinomyces culturomici]